MAPSWLRWASRGQRKSLPTSAFPHTGAFSDFLDNTPVVDLRISRATVPEPSNLLLLGVPLLVVGLESLAGVSLTVW